MKIKVKVLISILVLVWLFLNSCVANRNLGGEYDDLYVSTNEEKTIQNQDPIQVLQNQDTISFMQNPNTILEVENNIQSKREKDSKTSLSGAFVMRTGLGTYFPSQGLFKNGNRQLAVDADLGLFFTKNFGIVINYCLYGMDNVFAYKPILREFRETYFSLSSFNLDLEFTILDILYLKAGYGHHEIKDDLFFKSGTWEPEFAIEVTPAWFCSLQIKYVGVKFPDAGGILSKNGSGQGDFNASGLILTLGLKVNTRKQSNR